MKRPALRYTVLVLGIVTSILVAPAVGANDQPVLIGPYLQNLTSTGVVVRWVTAEPGNRSNFVYHRAHVVGGKPNHTYEYAVGEGAAFKGAVKTAPVEPVPFRFVVYGDTRTQSDVHARVIDRIVREEPEFVIHTGDLVADGRVPGQWIREFFGPAAPLMSKTAMFPVLGNHERNSALYYNLFELPGNERYYSFDYAQVHFIILDSNGPVLPRGRSKEVRWVDKYTRQIDAFWNRQLAWLEKDLRAHTEARLTVVCMHSPMYSSSKNKDRQESYERIRRRIKPIFDSNGIDAVFAGHDHFYERNTVDGIHYVVTGGGGAPLYDAGPALSTQEAYASAHHYVTVSVGDKSAQAQTVSIDGTVIDTFEIGNSE